MTHKTIRLQEPTYDNREIESVLDLLQNTMVVMGKKTIDFQNEWSRWQGCKYSTMVNSGSSANLLIINLLLSKRYRRPLSKGDEVLGPAVTWSTTLFPVIQLGLKPVLVDVSPTTFNIDLDSCKKAITPKTRAIFVVHLLGNPANMDKICEFCNENNLILIEDCCEATGSKWNGVNVGNFGVAASFSFMFAHHISTIEGGMVCCQDKQDENIIKASRAHGWIRELDEKSQREIEAENYFDDYRFMFWETGFNVRPTEVSAAFGLHQLEKLGNFIDIRIRNFRLYEELFRDLHDHIQTQCTEDEQKAFRSSFSFGFFFHDPKLRKPFITHLRNKGIECRLLVAGNLARHPFYPLYCDKPTVSLEIADKIHEGGLFLPAHQGLEEEDIDYISATVHEFFR